MIKLIWIIGNMGSGKSTICEELKLSLPHTHFNIDLYRQKYNKTWDMAGENKAREQFRDDLDAADLILLESVGTYGSDVLYKYKPEEIMFIRLVCDWPTSALRLQARIDNKKKAPVTPFPHVKGRVKTLATYEKFWFQWDAVNAERDFMYPYDFVFDTTKIDAKEIIKQVLKRIDMKNKLEDLQNNLENNNKKIYQDYKEVSRLKKEILNLMEQAREIEKNITNLKDENEDILADIRKEKGD